MTTTEKITLSFHGAEALAVVVFFAFMAWAVNSAREAIDAAQQKTLTATTRTMNTVNAAVALDGAKIDTLLATGNLTLIRANRMMEAAHVAINAETNALVGATTVATQTAQNASVMLQSANTSIRGLQPVVANANAELLALQRTTLDVDRQVSSPQLAATMTNIQRTTHNLELTTSDFERKFHDVLYPPCKGRWCWLIKGWKYFHAAGEMAEPVYFGIETYKTVRGNP